MTRYAVLVVLALSACTISPPPVIGSCGSDRDTCARERALSSIMLAPRP